MAAEGAIGLAVGLVGGAVGLILGSIRLPTLIRVLRVDPRIAAGTNLFIGFVMGSVGWVGHAVQGQVDYPLLVLMGSSAMAGSYTARSSQAESASTRFWARWDGCCWLWVRCWCGAELWLRRPELAGALAGIASQFVSPSSFKMAGICCFSSSDRGLSGRVTVS